MKRHLPALLVLLTVLTLSPGVGLAQLVPNVDGQLVDINDIEIAWRDASNQTGFVGQPVPVVPSVRTLAWAENEAAGVLAWKEVPNIRVTFTVNDGGVISAETNDGIVSSSSELILTTDSLTSEIFLSNWTLGSEPGTYVLTATVTDATDPDITTLSATALPVEDDPDTPDDPAPAPQQPLPGLTTDTAIEGIGAINNNIRRHLEHLRGN